MTSYSKDYGAYVETASTSLSQPADKAKQKVSVMKSADVALDTAAQAISETDFNKRIAAGKKILLRAASKHPKGTTFIGFEARGVGKLKLVLCRKQGAQRRLVEDELEQEALLEQAAAEGMVKRLRPLVEQLRKGTATTEAVVSAVRNEPDLMKALAVVTVLADTSVPLVINGKEVIGARESNCKLEKPNSERLYSLQLSVLSVNVESELVTCRLMGGKGIDAVFESTDVERCLLTLKASGDALILFGQCSVLGVVVKASCSVALLLNSRKRGFECGFKSIEDRNDLISRLLLAGRQQCPGLFG